MYQPKKITSFYLKLALYCCHRGHLKGSMKSEDGDGSAVDFYRLLMMIMMIRIRHCVVQIFQVILILKMLY